ncbi:MAG: hypothetical protein P4M05_28145 [Bradyrhizobium sp.]|nr:hypothetical protein [Bradyrhizobium sp.]
MNAPSVRFSTGKWVNGLAEWTAGDTAFLSVAFTWKLDDAYQRAIFYRALGFKVRAGGPGIFTRKHYLADVAEIGLRPGEQVPEAIVHHNPMATFASRGCPVGCWFCIVPKLEGRDFTEIPDFPVRPVLCDNNLSGLSAAYQQHIVDRYLATGTPLLDANSGFEPASFDDEVFRRWAPILKGPWRFGFDEKTEGDAVARAFRVLKDVAPRRKQVYTMIGHEPFDVCMDRIRRVIDSGGEPYAQPFIKLNALSKEAAIRHDWSPYLLRRVQRWVNWRVWKSAPFESYRPSFKTVEANVGGHQERLFG